MPLTFLRHPAGPLLALGLLWAMTCARAGVLAQQAPPSGPQEARSVWTGVFTDAQATRGAGVYKQTCERCHGTALTGEAGGASPLTGAEFMSAWNGSTVGALFRRILSAMPDDDPGTLTPQQDADVVAYVLSFNKFPAAKDELPADVERLKLIRFESTRPKSSLAASAQKYLFSPAVNVQ